MQPSYYNTFVHHVVCVYLGPGGLHGGTQDNLSRGASPSLPRQHRLVQAPQSSSTDGSPLITCCAPERQENNEAFNDALVPCTVRVWELVMPMEMAKKLANMPLSRYMKVGALACRVSCDAYHLFADRCARLHVGFTYRSVWCAMRACVALQL